MDSASVKKYVDRYEAAMAEHGGTRAGLCDGKEGRHAVRFAALCEVVLKQPDASVLDIGCGFADLYAFLRQNGWSGRYTGLDIVPGVLARAQERFPEVTILNKDASAGLDDLAGHDFVIASGVMNLALPGGNNEAHIRQFLATMFNHAKVAVCADFMSTYVDFRHPDAWHTDPAWALQVSRELTRRAILRLDYMPYEFALTLFKDQRVSPRNTFSAVDP